MGASAVLLIASHIGCEHELAALYNCALELGLEPLVETHNAAELAMAKRLHAGLIGINNRDIGAFEQDGGTVSTTEALCRLAPEDAVVVSESGILTPQDARRAVRAGADAVLIGTALLRARDPAALYRADKPAMPRGRYGLKGGAGMAYLKICGLMRAEDVAFCCTCGVDLVGFVVEYPKDVPWNLSVAQARALLAHLSGKTRSVIVTGGAPDAILRRAEALRPGFVQLHYRETPEETRHLVSRLHALGVGVIKALPVRADGTPDAPGFASAEDMAACYAQTGADLLLLDARVPPHRTHRARRWTLRSTGASGGTARSQSCWPEG